MQWMMRLKGFFSGNSLLIPHRHTPSLSLSFSRYFVAFSGDFRDRIRNSNGLEDVFCLYEDMSRTRPLPNVIQFGQLLSRVVSLKKYDAAICLFKDICGLGIPVDTYSMNIAINSCCLSNRVDLGFSLLGCFFKRGFVPDSFTFNALLKGLFRENRVNEAQLLFRKIVRDGVCELDIVTYGIVIDGLCKAGNTKVAMELLRAMEMGDCKPDTQAYNMVIDGLCKDGMVDSALTLFSEMSEKGILPNVITYGALIRGLCSWSRWREAKMLLKNMIDCRIYPNVVTFSIIVDALCKEGLMNEAEDVIRIMKKQNITPNVITYSSLMDGYCLQGRMDESKSVFDSLLAPNIQSYNILINGYCRKMIDDALHIFREMPSKGVEPDVTTYNTILQGLFRSARCSAALEIFNELQAVGLKPNFYTYCNMLEGLVKNGEVERALLLLDELEHREDEHVHIEYYCIVMDGLCESKNLDAARAIFSGLAAKGVEPSVATYNILINGCCQDGLVEEAKDLVFKMEQANLLSDESRSIFDSLPAPNLQSYNILINGYCRNKIDDALHIFREMPSKGVKPDIATYNTILQGLFRSARCSTALEIFNELQAVGLKPNFYTYCNMLEGLGKNGKVKRASLLLGELEHKEDEHVHIEYYNIVMDGLCESKNLDAARAIFRDLATKGMEPDVVTYTILIKGCCQNGLMEEAEDLVLEMEQANLLPDEVTYNILVQGFLRRGEFDAAERVLEQMKVKGITPRPSTCEKILPLSK